MNSRLSLANGHSRRFMIVRSISSLLIMSLILQLQLVKTTAKRSFSSTLPKSKGAAVAAFVTPNNPLRSASSSSLSSSSYKGSGINNIIKNHPSSSFSFSLYSTTQNNNSKQHQKQPHYYYFRSEAELLEESGYERPPVQWYPGHIAKAERQLSETLKAVDVVVEVRDARACKATAHPRVGEWCAGRPRIVVLTHLDMTPKSAVRAWQNAYDKLGAERWDDAPINTQVANQAKQARNLRLQFDPSSTSAAAAAKKKKQQQQQELQEEKSKKNSSKAVTPVEQVLFVNAKQGQGIHMLTCAIFKAGTHVTERRERRGLSPRALRVGIIGYPNVGKSALINRLLGRKRAKTANTPGVTRSLQWIRVRSEEKSNGNRKEFELLDSPGIIPAKMVDQSDALLLAACNCIGQAAYDNQAVAAYLCEWIKAIHTMGREQTNAPEWRSKCIERYGFDPLAREQQQQLDDGTTVTATVSMTGEDILFEVADRTCQGNAEDAARKILQDFRTGRMGPISLQLAPETEEDDGQLQVPVGGTAAGIGMSSLDAAAAAAAKKRNEEWELQQQARARVAVETAKERGLELPPIIENPDAIKKENDNNNSDDIGKGMFDGW